MRSPQVYLPTVFPGLFRCHGLASEPDSEWLHWPSEGLLEERELEFDPVPLSDGFSIGPPVQISDASFNVYQAWSVGENGPQAIVVSETNLDMGAIRPSYRDILNTGQSSKDDTDASVDLLRQFLQETFHRDRSFDGFLKLLLSHCADRWSESVAALYRVTDNGLKLRLASSAITGSAYLETEVAGDQADAWLARADKSEKQIWYDHELATAQLLSEPPEALLVLPGPAGQRERHLLVLAGPAVASPASVDYLRLLGRIISGLHESRFSSSTQTIALLNRLAELKSQNSPLIDVMQELMTALSRIVSFRRLVLSSQAGPAHVMTKEDSGRCTARIDRYPPVPPRVFGDLEPDQINYHRQIHGMDGFELSSERYLRDGVSSEMHVPVQFAGGGTGLFAIGTDPGDLEVLQHHEDLLWGVARFLGMYQERGVDQYSLGNVVGRNAESAEEARLKRRLEIVSKLTTGYYHEIMSQLAVVTGQTDILQRKVECLSESLSAGASGTGLTSIVSATDRVTWLMRRLRRITSPAADGDSQRHSARELAADLPSLIHGYSRFIHDRRSVQLEIVPRHQARGDLALSLSELFDCMMPLVVYIMEEAVCSGQMTLGMSEYGPISGLELAFNAGLIGHLGLDDLVTRVFPHEPWQASSASRGQVELGSLVLHYDSRLNDTYRLTLAAQRTASVGCDDVTLMATSSTWS